MNNFKYLKHTINTIDELTKNGVYCLYHKNNPDQKYIGSTFYITNLKSSTGFYNRLKHHIYYASKGKHRNIKIQKIADENGVDDFIFEIIEIIKNKDEIKIREQYWIDKLDSSNKGLNISPTSDSNKGCKFGFNNAKSKPICVYDIKGKLIAQFPSAREAHRIMNANPKNISSACKNKASTYKKLVWRFAEDPFDKYVVKDVTKNYSYQILQYDLNMNFIKKWNSLSEASNELKISIGNMSSCLNGRRNNAGGFIFKKDI